MVQPLCWATSEAFKDTIFNPGELKPIDSIPKLKVGDAAPDFALTAVSGETIRLSQYKGKKHVVLSFVPAAWTPVCSDQWPGYNLLRDVFEQNDAVLLGISVDNRPTLYAWTRQMGDLWFPVLSDFWPHGQVAASFGILRSDGVAERAIIMIDKAGIIRYFQVSDINRRPELQEILTALQQMHASEAGSKKKP
uniref:Peroxiredoxin n=1 Tax=Desulfatirhabdium butyrativorans TaxID=340467 RepID=A0A7C4VZW3_9BACT